MKWTKEEIEYFLTFLKSSYTIEEAIHKHISKFKIKRTYDSCSNALKRNGYKSPSNYLNKKEYTPEKSNEDIEYIKFIKKPSSTLESFCNNFDISPKKAQAILGSLQDKGYQIEFKEDALNLKTQSSVASFVHPVKIVKPVTDILTVASISDLHYGSIYCQKEYIKDFVDGAYSAGARIIFISGDLLSGYQMYRGWQNEQEVLGLPAPLADKQISLLEKNLPRRKGLVYYFVTGNHDLSFLNNIGLEAGVKISNARDDMVYLGQYLGKVDINGVIFELHHPDSGGAYAISYKLQKYIESTPEAAKPHISLLGHYHQHVYLYYMKVHGFYCGTFEAQSIWCKRKKLLPSLGGWLLKIGLDEDSKIRFVNPCFYEYHA